MGRIVVGVDGSNDSKAALRWAVEQAGLKGDEVTAVYVYGFSEEHNPFLSAYASFASSSSAPQTGAAALQWQEERAQATHDQAKGMLSSIVREVREDESNVAVNPVVTAGGRPAGALLDQARNGDLLVVGARGRGGFRGLRLGSIAEKCVRHAECPVMVVRAKGPRKPRKSTKATKRTKGSKTPGR